MSHDEMLTEVSVEMLSDAFPDSMQLDAKQAGEVVHGMLHARQWADRQRLVVGEEVTQIPRRLSFRDTSVALQANGNVGLMVACLQTQSADGFHRQRALQSVLRDVQPWSAPFVVALIGEYIVDIIEDIASATTPSNISTIAAFIDNNADYWAITKQRVASYWNVYYRHKYTRRNYPGFSLIRTLESEFRSRRRQFQQTVR